MIWITAALAQDLVTYDAENIVAHGDTPSITFTVQETGSFGFGVNCGVKRWSAPKEPRTAGSTEVLLLKGTPLGDHQCAGSIDIDMPDGRTGTLSFTLPVRSLTPIDWKTPEDGYDAEGRTLNTRASRALSTAEATLIGAGGATLEKVFAVLEDPAHPHFQWSTQEEILKIEVRAKDTMGANSTLTLLPWSYQIPHEDVVFASGEATVRDSEEPKLEHTWGDIERVIAKYGSIVEIHLYVAGYTDTVGDKTSNQALSKRRAKSIAQWFSARGFAGSIHYQGFGESVLAVSTPDETDAEPNRRALYVLAAAPPRSAEIPKGNWSPL